MVGSTDDNLEVGELIIMTYRGNANVNITMSRVVIRCASSRERNA